MADYVSVDELSEKLMHDIGVYSEEVADKSRKAVKEVRNQMKPMLESASPIRKYSTHTQVVKRIVVHRNPPIVRKAIKEVKEAKYQPGYFKQGWAYGSFKTKQGREIYGVRNKNMPTVVHLLNFDHDLISHRQRVGDVKGTALVDTVQDWGAEELRRKLGEFLDVRSE